MRILFLTLAKIDSVYQRGVYSDLIREIRDRGNEIVTITPLERRFRKNSLIIKEGGSTIIKVWTPNIQKTNSVEKTLGLLVIQYLYKYAFDKVNKKQNIDLILYSTPPITFNWIIGCYKKTFGAKTYLLLKDIFPQNAVDLEMMKHGSLVHKYFRKVEKSLYSLSDIIGTMSRANSKYLLKGNPEINPGKVELNPNSIEVINCQLDYHNHQSKEIPYKEKRVFIYGGNIGKPQNIEFLLEVISSCKDIGDAFFVIVGSGTELDKVSTWFDINKPLNALLLPALPQKEYEDLKYCDVGMIFLHPNFSIPNYPSRLLYYMLYRMPVLCATDLNTDIGQDAVKNNYGFWCEIGDVSSFKKNIKTLTKDERLVKEYGGNAFRYLSKNFNVKNTYELIVKHYKG